MKIELDAAEQTIESALNKVDWQDVAFGFRSRWLKFSRPQGYVPPKVFGGPLARDDLRENGRRLLRKALRECRESGSAVSLLDEFLRAESRQNPSGGFDLSIAFEPPAAAEPIPLHSANELTLPSEQLAKPTGPLVGADFVVDAPMAVVLCASEMLAMLEELASRSLDENGFECGNCAWCGFAPGTNNEHAPDCRLAALLKKAGGET